MRYGIEFVDGDFAVFGNFENRNRGVLHSYKTAFARYRRDETAVDAVMPNEKDRIIRMNGQKAVDESLRATPDGFHRFRIFGKHVVGNGPSGKTEFFLGFSLPISKRSFAQFFGEFQWRARMVRHDCSGGIGGTSQIARIRAVDAFRGKSFGKPGRLFFSKFVQRSRKVALEDSSVVLDRAPVAGEDDFHAGMIWECLHSESRSSTLGCRFGR